MPLKGISLTVRRLKGHVCLLVGAVGIEEGAA